MNDDLVVVSTTAPDDPTAARLAAALVERRLAACVQRSPIRSTYRWEGEVHDDDEVLLVVKTRRSRLEEISALVASLHPYELPEFVVVDADASAAYGRWVRDSTSGGGAA